MTSEIKTSFKGYYRLPGNRATTLTRSFVQFDGIGETANARARAIGGHAAARLGGVCMLKKPKSVNPIRIIILIICTIKISVKYPNSLSCGK